MNDQIGEEKDSFLEREKYSSIESERKNCRQESDHEEYHTSSLKNKTTHCPFEEYNPEIQNSGTEQSQVKTVEWLQGNIETRYIENQGFQHVFMFDSSNKTSSTLKLRNSDQLLDINDEDVTLMSHNEVLELVEKIPSNGNTTLIYWRRSSKSVTDVKFSLYEVKETFVVHLHHHSTKPDSTTILKRTVVWNKYGMLKFMQPLGKQSNRIVFKELVSKIPNKKPCDFCNSHFLEERILEEKGMSADCRRRYSATSQNGEKKYLHVTDAGGLILVHEISKSSEFELIPAQLNAFLVMKERSTNRCMKLEGDEGTFVCINVKHIRNIGDEFRFQLSRCRKQCNSKLSTKNCVII
ncbi:uncharacterized protein LOC143066529 isoform X2 [Mytilus galloprovincialis]|uniref:uncharacterized protein LOC143066529 isoform X2 n=1 Tax=Mytilus galloprovincialis TaxID=29158 RepID=UPI003F7B8EB6